MATRSNNEDAPTVLDTSLGPYLQQLRETQGFTLEQVSARIKYSRQQIAALEQENWAELPSGAPVRWLLRSYARFLQADEHAILAMYDNQQPAAASQGQPGQSTSWQMQDMSLYVEPRQRTWGWWLVALVLVVIVLFYAIDQGWIPESWLIFDWLRALSQ